MTTARRARRGAAALLALLASTTGCTDDDSSQATLSSSTIDDAAGDVMVSGLGEDPTAVAAAPRNRITDIISTTVEHTTDSVTVDVTFSDLRARQYLDLTAYLTTDHTGSGLPVQVTALTYRSDRSIDVYDSSGSSRCDAATVDVADEAEQVVLSVPRSCLGDPAWIEASVVAQTMGYDADPLGPSGNAVWEDDAYRDGSGARGTSPRLSPP